MPSRGRPEWSTVYRGPALVIRPRWSFVHQLAAHGTQLQGPIAGGSLEFRPGARRDTARRAGVAGPGRRPRHLALGRAGAVGGESGTPAPVLGRGRRAGRRPGPGNSQPGQHVGGRGPPLEQPGVVVEVAGSHEGQWYPSTISRKKQSTVSA